MSDSTSDESHRPTRGVVVDDPDAVVDGKTLTQWVEKYISWTFNAPFVSQNGPNTINDPTGSVAQELNPRGGEMYFITGAPSSDVPREFYVRPGESVLVPVQVFEDSEGPSIPPSIPNFNGSYADEVKTVLASDLSQLVNGAVTLDGEMVTPLPKLNTGIFSAGVATQGSVGEAVTGADAGASLGTSGAAGYFVVLKDLGLGTHTFTDTTTFADGHTDTHIDNIIVG